MLPTFLCIGTERGGTTRLYHILRAHPQIFVPEVKEPSFFNKYDTNLELRDSFTRLGLAWYERQFVPGHGFAVRGELTPLYLSDPEAASRIRETIPDIKLVCILRNPVDRAYSHYQMALAKGHVTGTFDNIINSNDRRFVERGFYARHLHRYLNLFSAEQILVLLFEDLLRDAATQIHQIAKFIGADPEFITEKQLEQRYNPVRALRSKALYNRGMRIATLMHESQLFWRFGRMLKRAGVNGLIRRLNESDVRYPSLTPDQYKGALEKFDTDISDLEKILGRSLEMWRAPPKQSP